jgi:hypothetical protein
MAAAAAGLVALAALEVIAEVDLRAIGAVPAAMEVVAQLSAPTEGANLAAEAAAGTSPVVAGSRSPKDTVVTAAASKRQRKAAVTAAEDTEVDIAAVDTVAATVGVITNKMRRIEGCPSRRGLVHS